MNPWTPIPPVEDTDAYIDYVNETVQDLPDDIFDVPGEDVPDVKYDFSIYSMTHVKTLMKATTKVL